MSLALALNLKDFVCGPRAVDIRVERATESVAILTVPSVSGAAVAQILAPRVRRIRIVEHPPRRRRVTPSVSPVGASVGHPRAMGAAVFVDALVRTTRFDGPVSAVGATIPALDLKRGTGCRKRLAEGLHRAVRHGRTRSLEIVTMNA